MESDLELRLPPDYVPQEGERINLYRELDNMESEEAVEGFRQRLQDRFGAIPATAEELIRVVPLRMAARRLGIERVALKGGKMRIFFVGDDNKAYYQSQAFGRVLGYLQRNPQRCAIRDVAGKRSFVISDVATVKEGLDVLRSMV